MQPAALALLSTALLLTACSTAPPASHAADAPAASPVPPLVGPTWALVRIQSMDDRVYTPGAPDQFTLTLHEDGGLEVKAHCNRGRGTWQSEGESQLRFGPMALTRAFCGEDSLDDRFLRDLSYVRSYVLRADGLYLATLADGAILEFRPLPVAEGISAPAFDCGRAEGSVEQMICADSDLSALDRELDGLYRKALDTFPPEEIATLKAYQRGWIEGRNDCWKADEPRACVIREYELRITELQIRTAATLVPEATLYRCEDGVTLSVYFHPGTRIPSAVVNRTPEQVVVFLAPSASGAKYEGRNVSFWTQGDEARLGWMGAETTCRVFQAPGPGERG